MEDSKVETLMKICVSGETEQQIVSIEELVELKAYIAVPVLIKLLSSPDDVVKFTAIQALGELGKENKQQVGSELIKLLTHPEEIVRSEAIDALGILGYSPAVQSVRSALQNDSSALVRASAAETLGDLGDSSVLNDLELSLDDPDESVRAYAVNSFGLLAKSSAASNLANRLHLESSIRVKAEILGAQYRLGSSEAFESLLDLINIADNDLATPLLNILEDLLERKTPAKLSTDAASICESLNRLAQRLSMQRLHAEEIIAKLQSISVISP